MFKFPFFGEGVGVSQQKLKPTETLLLNFDKGILKRNIPNKLKEDGRIGYKRI